MNNMQIVNRTLQRDKFAFSQIIKLHLTRLNYHLLTVNTRPLVMEKNFIPVKLILSVVTCVKNLETCATLNVTCKFTYKFLYKLIYK